jgi:hypothetical protein
MTDRLQCTLPAQPLRLMQPGPAAHAVVTPNTLRARLHTVSMWQGHYSDYAYDQLDRQQRDTVNEVNGEIQHGWDEPTANAMMQKIMDVATLERITINLSVTSATTFAITPGPNPNDSSHLEKTCRATVIAFASAARPGSRAASTTRRPCGRTRSRKRSSV